MIKVTSLKPNTKNPRSISAKAFRELLQKMKQFPDFLEHRPILIDKNNVIRAGNQRYNALLKLGYTEIPEEWVKKENRWDEKKLKSFELIDNVNAGEFDIDLLQQQYEQDLIELTGLVIQKGDFSKEIAKYNDDNAEYPLMPLYDEKYDAVVIITKTQTELAKLKTALGIQGKRQSYKNSYIGETNCVFFEETKISK